MTRINLLKRQPASQGWVESFLAPSGGSIVSRREALLGGLFLLLGCVILFHQLGGGGSAVSDAEENFPDTARDVGATPAVPVANTAPRDPAEAAGSLGSTEVAAASSGETAPVDADGELPGLRFPTPTTGASDGEVSGAGGEAPTPPASRAEPFRETGRLSTLAISSSENSLRIFAATGSEPEYKFFQLNEPNRVVVDLKGVVIHLSREEQDQSVSHPLVKRLRAAQYSVNPPVARIVLDVVSFPDIQFLPQFNGLFIRVSGIEE